MVDKTTEQFTNDNDDDNDDDNDEVDAHKNDGNDNDGLVGIAKLMDHWIHRAKKYQESIVDRIKHSDAKPKKQIHNIFLFPICIDPAALLSINL